ncbi:hypothetical protein ACFSQU_19950 [Massilia sp. GCM10020059]|uniref:Uncharacterized protein n=1 Tax=Massilia agrisoli TaxID=2892444 RepID=A0ABS8IVB6_9BURK|nr:hypothetical protein [Massilia agrisoli]MCC6071816.1 hypothetical protein [Massilia agrisoli]
MLHPARVRITGLLLALGLNAAFFAMFVWQARPQMADLPDPSRMALVWARPVVEAPAPVTAAPLAAGAPPARQARRPKRPAILAISEPAVTAATEAIVESDSADPFEEPGSATATSFDKAVIGKAIKVAMTERKALEHTQKFVKSGPGPNQYEQFASDVEAATIPYCYKGDAMKHTPPVIEVGSLKIPLGGVLALPFFAKAVATGKCRVK